MRLPFHLSLNAVLVILLGLGCWYGSYSYWGYSYHFMIAYFLTGLGCILFGITAGFSDFTPRGRILFRIAAISFIIGLPMLAFDLYELAASE